MVSVFWCESAVRTVRTVEKSEASSFSQHVVRLYVLLFESSVRFIHSEKKHNPHYSVLRAVTHFRHRGLQIPKPTRCSLRLTYKRWTSGDHTLHSRFPLGVETWIKCTPAMSFTREWCKNETTAETFYVSCCAAAGLKPVLVETWTHSGFTALEYGYFT